MEGFEHLRVHDDAVEPNSRWHDVPTDVLHQVFRLVRDGPADRKHAQALRQVCATWRAEFDRTLDRLEFDYWRLDPALFNERLYIFSSLQTVRLNFSAHVDLGTVLDALAYIPHLEIHLGMYATDTKLLSLMPLALVPASLGLDLSGSRCLSDAGIRQLSSLTGVTALSLAACSSLTDLALSVLQHLPALVQLDVSGCRKVTDTGVAVLCSGAACHLARLNLSGTGITDNALAALARLPRLERLSVSGCSHVTDEGLMALRHVSSLQRLEACNTRTWGTGLAGLATLPGLESLDLGHNYWLSTQGFEALLMVTGLRHLSLANCTSVSDCHLACLESLTRLTSLDLQGCKGVSYLGSVRVCVRLRSLSIARCHYLGDGAVACLQRLHCLTRLDLGFTSISNASLAQLASMTQLRALSLQGCKEPTDEGLVRVLGLALLEDLDIGSTRFTDVAVCQLDGLRHLRRLDTSGCTHISDRCRLALASNIHLQVICY